MALEIFDILTYDFAEDNSVSNAALLGIVTKTALITNTPTDDPTNYTDLLTATSGEDRPAGVYEFGFSLNWLGNFAQDKMMIAYRRSGTSSWTVAPIEPKDPDSRNLSMYTFPYTVSAPEILTMELQVTLWDDSLTTQYVDIYFCNAWIKRVS